MARRAIRGVIAASACLAITACAQIAGLEPYSAGCVDCSDDAGHPGPKGDAAAPPPDVSVPMCDGEACAPEASEGCDGDTCDAAISPPGSWSCAKGGCNAAGGACSAQGQGCYCTGDPSCGGGKCVKMAGKNDVSCASCNGSGPADGFGCQLGSPGIPASCTSTFGYAPSNLTAQQLAGLAPVGAVALTCSGTVTFSGSQWSGATCSQTLPAAKTITQSGGPSIDVLAFQSLTIAAGVGLNLTGSNAVMIVVFGDATVSGTIHADGAAGATSTLTAGTSGPGGAYNCGGSAGGNGMNASGTCSSPYNTNPCRDSGGGGGGGSTNGGAGNLGIGGTGGTGGSALSYGSLVPLYGGCPGGTSAGYACTTSGGGGGGAVQISVAGNLTISAGAAVSANGGTGGTSGCSASFAGAGLPYPGGGGGGGAGGAVLLEGQTVTASGAVSVNGGSGGDAQAGGGRGTGSTSASAPGMTGNLSNPPSATYGGGAGGGGGGGYGYTHINNTRPAATYACPTTLSPAPVCSSDHSACVCVDDSDCSSGKCVSSGQCTGRCSGVGAADTTRCELVTSTMPVEAGAGDAGDASAGDAGPRDASGLDP
jgi:hypothetical protein